MSLPEKRCLFTYLLSDLIRWAGGQGIHLAYGEGYVALTDAYLRKLAADLGATLPVSKSLHKYGNGAHYTGLGKDLIMYRPDKEGKSQPVENGDDPAWIAVGERWETMHSLARWGGRFQDANHFSLEHQGVS